jgi:hypothetical protein
MKDLSQLRECPASPRILHEHTIMKATCPELTLSQGGKTHKVKKQDVRRHDCRIS